MSPSDPGHPMGDMVNLEDMDLMKDLSFGQNMVPGPYVLAMFTHIYCGSNGKIDAYMYNQETLWTLVS